MNWGDRSLSILDDLVRVDIFIYLMRLLDTSDYNELISYSDG